MKDYKDTLFMGKTDFEMRGNLGQREPLFEAKWEELDLYHKRIALNELKDEFNLHDGPPYANGDIHVGHAMNKTLKDFVVRYKNMNGFKARYIPGWDTHGLPIENALTKSGVNRKQMSVSEFKLKCEEYAKKQVERQKAGFKRLGVLGEYENPYLTLDKRFEGDQIRIFAGMVKRGLIYKGLKPVYWSWSSESALAEAEIEYQDIKSNAIYFAFDLVDGSGNLQDAKVLVWTTTPWTLPCNLAVAAGPDIDYVLVNTNKGKFLMAKELKDSLVAKLGLEDVSVLEELKGTDLVGYHYKHALYERVSPFINADYVTTTDGTGFVHIAPGYGAEDYEAGKKNGLDIMVAVDSKGFQTEASGPYAGMFYEDSEKAIMADLEAKGALLLYEPIVHSYPHDWRTKKPVIFRATPQWFASIDPIKDEILEEIKNVKWYPSWGEIRISNMIKDRHDWCISRQRAWGVPIPVMYCEDGEPILDLEVLDHVATLFDKYGSNCWNDLEPKDLLPEGYKNPHSPNGIYTKEKDIMDVWFDSGSSYMTLKRRGLNFPSDLYLEGADQYRGWFNSSIITSVANFGVSPYKANVTHGFVLDGEGRKMSKSLGNVVDPNKVFNQYGADILRLWVASTEYNVDVRISDAILKQIADSYRKIRNTIRFLLANISDFNPDTDKVDFKDMPNVDKYMMAKLQDFVNRVKAAYDEYEFQNVYRSLMQYVSQDLSAFYLDFTKDILYIEAQKGLERRSVQTVLFETCSQMLRLITPILPHTATEAYAFLPGNKLADIYLEDMPKERALNVEEKELINLFDSFMNYRDQILKALEEARNNHIIGKSFNAKLTITLDKEAKELFDKLNANIRQILIVSQLELKEGNTFDVLVEEAQGETCSRCWQIVPSINEDELCPRCAKIVGNLK